MMEGKSEKPCETFLFLGKPLRAKGGVPIFELGIGRGAIPMVLKFQCPECGARNEVVEVLPERGYRMNARCECTTS
jgi:hypothetical protein